MSSVVEGQRLAWLAAQDDLCRVTARYLDELGGRSDPAVLKVLVDMMRDRRAVLAVAERKYLYA